MGIRTARPVPEPDACRTKYGEEREGGVQLPRKSRCVAAAAASRGEISSHWQSLPTSKRVPVCDGGEVRGQQDMRQGGRKRG